MNATTPANSNGKKTQGLNSEPSLRVLDCVILDPSAWAKAQRLSPDDFFDDAQREMFFGMRTLNARNQEPNLPNLMDVVDRDKFLLFNKAQSDLFPRTNPSELDVWIQKAVRETAMRMATRELDRIHASAANGGIAEADLVQLGEIGRKLQSSASASDSLFQTLDDFEQAPPLSFAIENFLQNHGITGIAGLSGHGKTFVMLSIVKSLLAGPTAQLWGLFPVVERAERVIYLIPESTVGPFKHRLKSMGLYQYIQNERLLVRTLEKGPLDLTDARLIGAVKGAHIFLDTAIRFMNGDENKAEDNRAFAFEAFGLLQAGARSIVAAYHSPKSFRRDFVMDLEGILRGGGDLGASLATCWAVKQIDAESNTVHVENVKPRDFAPPGPFELVGRPHIDNTGDFMLLKAPGQCGTLAEEAPPLLGGNKQAMRDAKASNKQLLKAWLAEDQTYSLAYLVDRFLAAGIPIDRATVSRYRREIANEHQ